MLADRGYVLHVTGSLDRDGPWTTGCGNNPATGRIVEALRDQGPELRLCRECMRVYSRSVEARLVIEHYRIWPERWWGWGEDEGPWLIEQADPRP